MRTDKSGRINLRGRVDDGGRVDGAWEFGFRKEKGKRFGETDSGLRDLDKNFFGIFAIAVHQNGGGGALFSAFKEDVVFSER